MPTSACAALPAPPSLPLPNNSASRTRFSLADDIAILLEVINFQPYTDPCRWTEIVEKLNKDLCRSYTVRSIKERVDLIAAQFLQNDRRNLQKSGTEEGYGERDRLLQQVVDPIKEFGHRITQTAKKTAEAAAAPTDLSSRSATTAKQSAQREDALAYNDAESMAFCGDVLVEAAGPRQNAAVLDYLHTRGCQDMDRDAKRLALEERIIAHKERKHREQMEERRHEREMWAEERAKERCLRAKEREEDMRLGYEELRLLAEERRQFAAQQEAQIKIMQALVDALKK
ncbi:hypothetical protein HPB48_017030 [Haemaphysalis longicornis]|uniref:Uncharacterized protein n=1 Tax=Haemaphysalis longicornis TaxID=44386 RepID=A0A9J6FMU3_HAELO|nr:hypothetical protein HPB48_017030 [Haemaphysalis longicornis]